MIEDSLEYDDNHYMNQSPGLTIMIHCDYEAEWRQLGLDGEL